MGLLGLKYRCRVDQRRGASDGVTPRIVAERLARAATEVGLLAAPNFVKARRLVVVDFVEQCLMCPVGNHFHLRLVLYAKLV